MDGGGGEDGLEMMDRTGFGEGGKGGRLDNFLSCISLGVFFLINLWSIIIL